VVCTIQALLHYIYMAQFPLQSELTLHKMAALLDTIHQNKQVFIKNGSCSDMDHLRIPKLYSLPCSIENAHFNGVSTNFTTKTAEYLHISMCKDLYNATNHHQYDIQMLHLLDMHKKIHFHSAYVSW
ncbi:hypothetical protein BS47DRAFT_1277064, partial [Hydnum rufescens UP504]